MGQSFGPQADSLSRHRFRYRALGRNFGRSRSDLIVLRTEASPRLCGGAPHELGHGYHHQTPLYGRGGVRLSIERPDPTL